MKLVVFDNSTEDVHVFPYDPSVWGSNTSIDKKDFNVQDFYDAAAKEFEVRLKDSECSYMVVLDLNINIH